MEKYYYLLLNIGSILFPFIFSFERRWMHFVRFWKPYFIAIIGVGMFFILWDIYFAYQGVWGFNDRYLIGIRIFRLPLEEWMFFLLIPYASNFIHYSLEYFFPRINLSRGFTQNIAISSAILGFGVMSLNLDRLYTASSFGLFGLVMFLQAVFQWRYARRFFLSFCVIYIPFYFVNSALTGAYSPGAVVYYNDSENLGVRLGTIPLEDSFYCFSMLYASVLLFEFLRKKYGLNQSMNYKETR